MPSLTSCFPPAFPFLILPLYFRYHTMRYKFTEDGISMSWGILFRHEIIVNYARIQDIHLRSNLVERWFSELTTKSLRRGTHRTVRELNADIPPALERIVLKCIACDPDDRYPYASVLVRDLQAALYV